MNTTFTPDDLSRFRRYVKVQESGHYNMFDNRAAAAACLTRDQMIFIMTNYNELNTANEAANKEETK